MLTFPKLEKLPSKELCISKFNGINTDRKAPEDSISLAYNISTKTVPSIVTREARKCVYKVPDGEKIKSLLYLDRPYLITEAEGKMRLYYGDGFVPRMLTHEAAEDEILSTTFCKYGKMTCIFNIKKVSQDKYESLFIPYPKIVDEIKRIELPYFVDVMVFKNRIFGVGEHAIYACAFAEIENWNSSENREDIFNKAFEQKQNATAPFTACKIFRDTALFFTSRDTYKLTGLGTDTFMLDKIANVGAVSKNAVCECGGKLYFMSHEGLMQFNGNYVSCVHTPFGNFGDIKECLMGAGQSVLYIDIKYNNQNESAFYTYNTKEGGFASEEEWSFVAAQTLYSKPYFATEDAIYEFESSFSQSDEEMPTFRVETQKITDFLPKRNGTVKIEVGLNLEKGAMAEVWADIDDKGWQVLYTILDGEKDVCIPLVPMDISSIKIALVGEGEAKVRYITLRCNDSKRG